MRSRPLLPTFLAVLLAAAFGGACDGEQVRSDDAGDVRPQPVDGGVVTEAPDAGAVVDGGFTAPIDGGATPISNCRYELEGGVGVRTCPYETFVVATPWGDRAVHVATPVGPEPPGGFPAVFYFQGSFFAGEIAFSARDDSLFGEENLTQTVEALLDDGFVVVAPDAIFGSYWQTNIPPAAFLWDGTADDTFMLALLDDVEAGRFAAIDTSRLFAMGISSGGFMTSRMAVSYPGVFRALAVHSGSYAICGAVCVVPDLPLDHPPTLFVHGNADLVVFPAIMEVYRDKLEREGFTTSSVFVVGGGHEWLPEATTAVPAFFRAHD